MKLRRHFMDFVETYQCSSCALTNVHRRYPYTLLNTSRSQDDIHRGMMGHRSHSAAPMDSPSVRYRGRSQSPTGHRSLSPPEHRSIPYSHGYVYPTRYEISPGTFDVTQLRRERLTTMVSRLAPHLFRFGSRSATATPTGSPKKRQLPQIPAALKERVAQDLEERVRFMRHRNRPGHTIYRSTGMGGESLFSRITPTHGQT